MYLIEKPLEMVKERPKRSFGTKKFNSPFRQMFRLNKSYFGCLVTWLFLFCLKAEACTYTSIPTIASRIIAPTAANVVVAITGFT